jgi:type I restriction enzyme M protein
MKKQRSGEDAMTKKMTKGLIDRIFKEPGIKYELTEFETLRKPIHDILDIFSKTVETGRDAGKAKYYRCGDE